MASRRSLAITITLILVAVVAGPAAAAPVFDTAKVTERASTADAHYLGQTDDSCCCSGGCCEITESKSSIWRLERRSGVAPVRLVEGIDHLSGMVVVTGELLFFSWSEKQLSLRSVPVAGGPVVTVWTGRGYYLPRQVAADDRHVYWTANNRLYRVDRSRGTVERLWRGGWVIGLSVDDGISLLVRKGRRTQVVRIDKVTKAARTVARIPARSPSTVSSAAQAFATDTGFVVLVDGEVQQVDARGRARSIATGVTAIAMPRPGEVALLELSPSYQYSAAILTLGSGTRRAVAVPLACDGDDGRRSPELFSTHEVGCVGLTEVHTTPL